jgi:hypothetical protein
MKKNFFTLKNGQFKDFMNLHIYYGYVKGKDDIYDKIFSASVMSGLQGRNKKQEREIMYSKESGWLEVINLL